MNSLIFCSKYLTLYVFLAHCIFIFNITSAVASELPKIYRDIDVMLKNNTTELHQKERIAHFPQKLRTANTNLRSLIKLSDYSDANYVTYHPGDFAEPFDVPVFSYSGKTILHFPPSGSLQNLSLTIAVYNPDSGFSQCFFNCSDSFVQLTRLAPSNAAFLFASTSVNAYGDMFYFFTKYKVILKDLQLKDRLQFQQIKDVQNRLYFAKIPLSSFGNWITDVVSQWRCLDHNCGLDQVQFMNQDSSNVMVVPRLDAHYDWLPNPVSLSDKSFPVRDAGDGCGIVNELLNQSVALVTDSNCSYFEKVKNMAASGAVAVLVLQSQNHSVDMNCINEQCSIALGISASSIPQIDISSWKSPLVRFQNTPADNLFVAIDPDGKLSEVGWALYPSMAFLAWQAQWFIYKEQLNSLPQPSDVVIEIFNNTPMVGKQGAQAFVTLPQKTELQQYEKMYLDMSLFCPGSTDKDCGHWDRIVSLKVCCDQYCNPTFELGRWITPFRRRIGRWVTDVTPLLPLLNGDICLFFMPTPEWAVPWLTTLNLRLNGKRIQDAPKPERVVPLYNGNIFIFDKNYNTLFPPQKFAVLPDFKKVELLSVITGHGSDENGCGEFCVSKHIFTVNGKNFSNVFSDAGTPLGCASKVLQGVVPNEHGTWLYGRGGWCDGQQVNPWVVDLTFVVSGQNNTIMYTGLFNDTNPNPTQNPGAMVISSYIIFYL